MLFLKAASVLSHHCCSWLATLKDENCDFQVTIVCLNLCFILKAWPSTILHYCILLYIHCNTLSVSSCQEHRLTVWFTFLTLSAFYTFLQHALQSLKIADSWVKRFLTFCDDFIQFHFGLFSSDKVKDTIFNRCWRVTHKTNLRVK